MIAGGLDHQGLECESTEFMQSDICVQPEIRVNEPRSNERHETGRRVETKVPSSQAHFH